MDITTLKYFQFVAMYRNFSRAAEHFYIGQPALSRQIANLERELGVQLFIRDTRNVTLTNAGKVLYDQVQLLIRHHEFISEMLSGAHEGTTGNLSFATVADFTPVLVEPVRSFVEKYPDVRLQIDDIPFDHLTESIIHGVYDVAAALDFTVPHDDRFAYRTIARDHLVVVMATDYPYSGPDPITADALRKLPLLQPRHATPPTIRHLFTPEDAGGVVTVPNTRTALLRTLLGLGTAVLPYDIIARSNPQENLRYCEIDSVETEVNVLAVYRRDNAKGTLKNFLSFLSR